MVWDGPSVSKFRWLCYRWAPQNIFGNHGRPMHSLMVFLCMSRSPITFSTWFHVAAKCIKETGFLVWAAGRMPECPKIFNNQFGGGCAPSHYVPGAVAAPEKIKPSRCWPNVKKFIHSRAGVLLWDSPNELNMLLRKHRTSDFMYSKMCLCKLPLPMLR